jgi:tetratricopeptide (TPR) repeat protein
MKSSLLRAVLAIACLAGVFDALPARAEHGFVLVEVQNTAHQPVRRVEIGIEGCGSSSLTDDHGKARLSLCAGAKEGDWLPLVVLHSPPGTPKDKQFVMISPWDGRAQVPPFEDKPENFVRAVLVQQQDRAALENDTVLASLAQKIDKANAPKSARNQGASEDPKVSLDLVAKQYGLGPDEVDKAIRAWGTKTTDPYEVGLAALYERNFPKASARFQDSLKQREDKLTTDQKKVVQDQDEVADAAFFLGQSLHEEGKYRESAQAYERCLQIRKDDAAVLNNAAGSLDKAGDDEGAVQLYRQSLAIFTKGLGSDDQNVAVVMGNLAGVLKQRGDLVGAEQLYRQSLATFKKALGPGDPHVAVGLINLGAFLFDKGDYPGAESLERQALTILEGTSALDHLDLLIHCREGLALSLCFEGHYEEAVSLLERALVIDEKALGPDDRHVADDLKVLGSVHFKKGDYVRAEPFDRRALGIYEKALGPDDPEVAETLNSLGVLLALKHDYVGAEPLYRRALTIDEKSFGPDDPEVATPLRNLANLLADRRDYVDAEPLYRRVLAIDEKRLGPDHPKLSKRLNELALLLGQEGKYAEAEPLLRRALAIDEKTLGPSHPDVTTDLRFLLAAIYREGNYAGAEPLSRRVLANDERTLGPHHPDVARDLTNLGSVLQAENDDAGAELSFRRALEINMKALGADHADTRLVQSKLDTLLEAKKKQEK